MIIKSILKIPNPEQLFLKDRLGLIQKIMRAALLNFPFQNATSFGAFLPLERKTPGFKKILTATVKGEGGLCGHLNNYMKMQLESIGYQADLVGGEFRRTGIPMSHFLVKVKIPGYAVKDKDSQGMGHVREDRTYLVDVGCGIPLHEPIWVEKLPYRGRAGGLNYRYERVDDITIRRVNENGDALMGEKPESYLSPQDYVIDLRPKKFTEFTGPVHAVYSNPRSVFLHQGLYCFRYLDITEDDFQIVCIRGTELMFITKETRHVQSFSSYEDIKPSIFKHFPMISKSDVELTVKHFSIPFEEALKMTSNN